MKQCYREMQLTTPIIVFVPFMLEEYPLEEDKMVFFNNLEAQTTHSFLDFLHEVNCSRNLQPPESTDLIQAVDA